MWYELVPAASVPIRLRLYPGNRVHATVTVSGRTVTFRIANLSRHAVFTKRVTARALDVASAEWVAEAPSTCGGRSGCRLLPLAPFGTVRFAKASATTDTGLTGTPTSPAFDATPITLSGGPGFGRFAPFASATAAPGGLSVDGSSFPVVSTAASAPKPPVEAAPTTPTA